MPTKPVKPKLSMPRSPKKKVSISQGITANSDQIYLVLKSGIKVYPVKNINKTTGKPDKHWYVEVDNNGIIKRFDKTVSDDDLNEAIAKTIIHYANLLKEKKTTFP